MKIGDKRRAAVMLSGQAYESNKSLPPIGDRL